MNKCLKIIVALLFMNIVAVYGQDHVQMADNMRTEGKIYVVVAIVLIILTGLILYLFLLDNKIKRLEKLIFDKEKQTN